MSERPVPGSSQEEVAADEQAAEREAAFEGSLSDAERRASFTEGTLLQETIKRARAEQPLRIKGFKESMRERWEDDGHDPADFDERWEQFCEEAKADPTLGGKFPFMAEKPVAVAADTDEPITTEHVAEAASWMNGGNLG